MGFRLTLVGKKLLLSALKKKSKLLRPCSGFLRPCRDYLYAANISSSVLVSGFQVCPCRAAFDSHALERVQYLIKREFKLIQKRFGEFSEVLGNHGGLVLNKYPLARASSLPRVGGGGGCWSCHKKKPGHPGQPKKIPPQAPLAPSRDLWGDSADRGDPVFSTVGRDISIRRATKERLAPKDASRPAYRSDVRALVPSYLICAEVGAARPEGTRLRGEVERSETNLFNRAL